MGNAVIIAIDAVNKTSGQRLAFICDTFSYQVLVDEINRRKIYLLWSK